MLSGGFGRSEVWGAFFLRFRQAHSEKKKQIPRTTSRAPENQGQSKSARDSARDDKLLLGRIR